MSQFAAVTSKVKPGFDEELARLFENYPRPDSFVITDDRALRELGELRTEFLEVPRDTSSPTAFRVFFLAHSMRCLVARRHDQPAAVVSEAWGNR